MSIGLLLQRIAHKTKHVASHNVFIERWRMGQRRRILTRAFLTSTEYERMIMVHHNPSVDGRNSAESMSPNFKYRHFVKNSVLGAWRWLGVFEKRDVLREFVFSSELLGLDFGGARGPISLEVEICDRLPKDAFGRRVRYNDISDIRDNSLDYVWSSHTLEHIPELDRVVALFHEKIKPGGKLVLLLPAYTCQRWRAGEHRYRDAAGDSSHVNTFCLSSDVQAAVEYCRIDEVVGRSFKVEIAEMVGDNSIFLMATR